MLRIVLPLVTACLSLCALARAQEPQAPAEEQEQEQEAQAQEQKPEAFVASETAEASATVESVNRDARTVVLRTDDGDRLLLEAGPEVRNFDRIEPGDHVRASYHEALIAAVTQRGATDQEAGGSGTQASQSTARAPEGERPAGAVVNTVVTTVHVQAVDPAEGKVTFRRPDGIVRVATVETPEAKEFVSQLKPDDEVQITYKEALAVRLEPDTER
jgi:hypothetical protein